MFFVSLKICYTLFSTQYLLTDTDIYCQLLISTKHNTCYNKLTIRKIKYSCTATGFPTSGTCPYACTRKARTLTDIRTKKKNTDHRTREIEIKTYKTTEQK